MWFGKRKRRDIWDEPMEAPVGDIDAAQRIRDICRAAADSAERSGPSLAPPDKNQKSHRERYERAAKAAMEIAMKMADELMRDCSVAEIVGLCMKADDQKTARILLRAIQSVSIRDDVMSANATLRQ